MHIDTMLMKRLLNMGIPMALQFSITAVGGVILQSAVNPYGSDIVATVTAANKVQFLLTQPMEAIGATIATFASQNLGAGKYSRIVDGVKKSLIVSMGFCVISFGIGTIFGSTISLLFIESTETAIIAGIEQYLFFMGLAYPMLAILLILRNAVQGLQYSVPAMAAGLFELVARALVGIIFVRPFGFIAICFANPAAWVAAVVLLVPVYMYVIKQVRVQLIAESRDQFKTIC
jgi:Na+-driven multidrug efflux pump